MKKIAPVFIIASGCLWGSMGLFVRRLNGWGFSSMPIVEVRCVLTAVLLFALLAAARPALLRVQPRHLWCFLGTGVASMVLFNYCYFSTITLASLSAAAILLYTAPIFVMLLSCPLFGERLTGRKLLCLALAFGGCVLVCGAADGALTLTPRALLLGLGSGVGYALYSIFSRFALQRGYQPLTITAYTFLFASLGGALCTDLPALAGQLVAGGGPVLGFFVIYTLVTTVIPYILYTTGLQYVENGKASVLASVEPVVATLLGFVVFGEALTLPMLVGAALVGAALFGLSRPGRTRP